MWTLFKAMRANIALITIFLTLILTLTPACAINVTCSMPDFMPIVKAIGKDKVNVTSIMPPGTDPHSFTITKSKMESLENSDLILLVNSEFLHFEEKIKKKYGYKCLDFEDYKKNGATLDSFPKYKMNPHGYWLKLDNGVAIAKTLKETLSKISPKNKDFFEKNFYVFLNEIEDAKKVTKEIIAVEKLENKSCVAIVPGVCYIIQNMGMEVGDVLLSEELGFASGKSIAEIEEKLKSEYSFIVLPEFMKDSKAGEIAKQLSKDTGKPIVYVKFVMAGKNDSYTALHYKNLISFAKAKSLSKTEKEQSYELILALILLVTIPILIKMRC